MSQELEFSEDPAIRVAPEPALSREQLLRRGGSLARPGVAIMGDPEDEDEEEEKEKKKREQDEDEPDEDEDGEKEEPLHLMKRDGTHASPIID